MPRSITAIILSLLIFTSSYAQKNSSSNETADQKAKRIQWWRNARFGMFIHWGPVSLEGTEISWSRGGERRGIEGTGQIPVDVYDNLYKKFDPEKFNAEQWVSIAKSTGMKYMVLVAKHCDGFCMWKSKIDDYNIGNSPFKRDICGELAQAAHKDGMRIGWYYSPMDWRDPDCRTERNDIYVKKMQGHLKELLGNYGRIDLLWFDAEGGPIPWHQDETYKIIKSLQPQIVLNDRLWLGRYDDRKPGLVDPRADYKTPEQRVGAFDDTIPWETCMTLGTQWSWKPNDKIKSYDECIRILVQCVTGDGNLLLNVGPMPDGRIEPRQVKVLEQIGEWMKKYGESIYGTRGGPFKNGTWGGSTRNKNIIYLHIMRWDGEELHLPALNAKIIKAQALTGGKVHVNQSVDGINISMSWKQHNNFDTIIKLKMNQPVDKIESVTVPTEYNMDTTGITLNLLSNPDSIFTASGSKTLIDGILGTTDRTDGNWLGFEKKNFEVLCDFKTPRKINKAVIGAFQEQVSAIFYPRAISIFVSDDGKEFKLAGKMDTNQPIEDAEILRKNFTISFQQVKVRYVKIVAENIGSCPSWHANSGRNAWMLFDEISIE